MNEREFKIGEKQFQLNKIDVFKQFHIARKLGPIMADIIPAAVKVSKLGENMSGDNLDQLAELAAPIMDGFAKLSDQDANYILMGLLECVEMKQLQYGNFAFVVKNGNLMIQDLEMAEMLQAAGRALMYNMKGFFSSMPQPSKEGKSKQKGQ